MVTVQLQFSFLLGKKRAARGLIWACGGEANA